MSGCKRRSKTNEASPQTDEACVAGLRRTPVAAPLCGRIRVHSRLEASVREVRRGFFRQRRSGDEHDRPAVERKADPALRLLGDRAKLARAIAKIGGEGAERGGLLTESAEASVVGPAARPLGGRGRESRYTPIDCWQEDSPAWKLRKASLRRAWGTARHRSGTRGPAAAKSPSAACWSTSTRVPATSRPGWPQHTETSIPFTLLVPLLGSWGAARRWLRDRHYMHDRRHGSR